MSPIDGRMRGKAHWRSLDDLAGTPEYRALVEREFPLFADEMLATPDRRSFLKIMGASLGLAGLTACRWPAEEIVPFAHRPEGYVPGNPVSFATAMELAGAARGLLVTSYDGRPVKVEGNPVHPGSLGGTDALAQASILGLYDPDRSRGPARYERGAETPATWDAFEAFAGPLFRKLASRRGTGLRVLSEASSSASLADVRRSFDLAFPEARWHEYEPFSMDAEREGTALAFGKPYRVRLALDRARVVVALDADPLSGHPDAVRHAHDFARGRRGEGGQVSRLYAAESAFSLTGAAADYRVPILSRDVARVAGRLAAECFLKEGLPLPPETEGLAAALGRFLEMPSPSRLVTEMARDLLASRGASVVACGPRQAAETHALVHVLNAALGNVGATVFLLPEPDAARPSHVESLRDLATVMASGGVETLLILGGNPVFDAPVDLRFADALSRVRHSIHLSPYRDETSRACRWHLNRSHFLESWDDARGWDGTLSVVQPLIEPLWSGRTPAEVLALLHGGAPRKGYEIVRSAFRGILGEESFEARWRKALHDGLVEGSAFPEERPQVSASAWAGRLASSAAAERLRPEEMEIVFARDVKIHDGRFANNGWLQELPDPITKLTWDNAALLAPATAADLGVSQGDVVRVTLSGRSVELPVFVVPGQVPGSVIVSPGYGRTACGRVGDGVGVDAYAIRTAAEPGFCLCRVRATGRHRSLATTQDHHVVDTRGIRERTRRAAVLVREVDVAEFASNPGIVGDLGPEHHEVRLWKEHENGGRRWALAIDLSACIGCGACTIACQAENNIPVVGRREVARGREMHWIRVDRYFAGEPGSPSVSFQPMTCHHCEDAPCEQVCPVGATMHDRDGLNVMVYNRCVGTRYCSNNCPYKVRRFNWFNNHESPSPLETMVFNPEVTVRGRGVMEKCTFCLQRIEAAKIAAKNEGRPIRDGEITTACEQVCPSRAIVFGDLADPESRVGRLHRDPRSYAALQELNVKPRLRYLARLRNRGGGGGPETEGRA